MDSLVTWLAAPGALALLYGLGRLAYKLHTDAINAVREGADKAIEAERRRADDARAGREAAEKRADLHEEQLRILLRGSGAPPPTSSQPPSGRRRR